MIYTINANGYLLYSIAKAAFGMSDEDVYEMINEEFAVMIKSLEKKGVKYSNLKRALVPNQDKNNKEVCLVFDISLIPSSFYGYEIFEKILPLLDKESTYSILAGDYIDIIRNSQYLCYLLEKEIIKCNASLNYYGGQYYLVYFNSITDSQLKLIINGLRGIDWFYGYIFLNVNSKFKTYISNILIQMCIKNKNTVIVSHLADCSDSDNINIMGYPYEENGFNLISINQDSFNSFLTYKIESILPDKEDVSFSFNALFPRFDCVEKLKLTLSDGKWEYLNDDEKGKGGILKSLEFESISKEEFSDIIYRKICNNYIYNLNINEYGDRLFNVCVELPTKSGNVRRTTVALKYKPACGEIDIVTIT